MESNDATIHQSPSCTQERATTHAQEVCDTKSTRSNCTRTLSRMIASLVHISFSSIVPHLTMCDASKSSTPRFLILKGSIYSLCIHSYNPLCAHITYTNKHIHNLHTYIQGVFICTREMRLLWLLQAGLAHPIAKRLNQFRDHDTTSERGLHQAYHQDVFRCVVPALTRNGYTQGNDYQDTWRPHRKLFVVFVVVLLTQIAL